MSKDQKSKEEFWIVKNSKNNKNPIRFKIIRNAHRRTPKNNNV
jgi:hypothetical protein